MKHMMAVVSLCKPKRQTKTKVDQRTATDRNVLAISALDSKIKVLNIIKNQYGKKIAISYH
jgi:hypothetical protein